MKSEDKDRQPGWDAARVSQHHTDLSLNIILAPAACRTSVRLSDKTAAWSSSEKLEWCPYALNLLVAVAGQDQRVP